MRACRPWLVVKGDVDWFRTITGMCSAHLVHPDIKGHARAKYSVPNVYDGILQLAATACVDVWIGSLAVAATGNI